MPDGPLHHLPFDALRARSPRSRSQRATSSSSRRRRRCGSSRAPAAVPAVGGPWCWRIRTGCDERTDASERQACSSAASRSGAFPTRGVRAGRSPAISTTSMRSSARWPRSMRSRPSELRDYELVHFAAHAVADETHPERSAVFLAPGDTAGRPPAGARDRRARSRRTDRRAVCLPDGDRRGPERRRGAEHRPGVLRGRRPRRVGTRWHIRDEDAASLFETFYRALGRGSTLSPRSPGPRPTPSPGASALTCGPAWCCSATARVIPSLTVRPPCGRSVR